MARAVGRAVLGFIAGALAVMTFHQGMIGALHAAGLISFAPFPIGAVPPLGIPRIVDLCFWGGVWGVLFGLLLPWLPGPDWLRGIGLGVVAALTGLFVVVPLKGGAIAGSLAVDPVVRSLVINGFWGLGVGFILPGLLAARRPARA
jgi:hypothetical protein